MITSTALSKYSASPYCSNSYPDYKNNNLKIYSNQNRPYSVSLSLETPSCTCKDKISWNGYGNCRKASEIHSGQTSCFVVLPTGCPDAMDSMTVRGEKTSAAACKKIGKPNSIISNAMLLVMD